MLAETRLGPWTLYTLRQPGNCNQALAAWQQLTLRQAAETRFNANIGRWRVPGARLPLIGGRLLPLLLLLLILVLAVATVSFIIRILRLRVSLTLQTSACLPDCPESRCAPRKFGAAYSVCLSTAASWALMSGPCCQKGRSSRSLGELTTSESSSSSSSSSSGCLAFSLPFTFLNRSASASAAQAGACEHA